MKRRNPELRRDPCAVCRATMQVVTGEHGRPAYLVCGVDRSHTPNAPGAAKAKRQPRTWYASGDDEQRVQAALERVPADEQR